MPDQILHLVTHYDDDRLRICPFGLFDSTAMMNVYGSNGICEASLYPNKRDVDRNVVTSCRMFEASEFFRDEISADDRNIMKFNCEGAETAIINNLIDSGEIWKVSNMCITWDCRVIAGEEYKEAELIARMNSIGYDRWVSSDEAFAPHTMPHPEKIAQWLGSIV